MVKAKWQGSDNCRDNQGDLRGNKVIANKKRCSTKDYINTALVEAIERDKFLQSYAPSLSKIVYEDDTLFI